MQSYLNPVFRFFSTQFSNKSSVFLRASVWHLQIGNITINYFGNILHNFLLLLASKECLICKEINQSSNALCFSCWSEIKFISYDHNININLNDDFEHIAVMNYNHIAEKLVSSLKYYDQYEYAKVIAQFIYYYLKMNNISYDIIIPVPLSRKKLWQRKFNHMVLIAKEIVKLGKNDKNNHGKLLVNYLLKTKDTVPQVSLTKQQREHNLRGKFALNHKMTAQVKDKVILLLDDVMTTGSTLKESRKTLELGSPKKIISVTLARTHL